jgi:hypothetical protein
VKSPTAFKATYSDWKLVKTRGVVQIVFEVPLAEADSAYELLGGMPIVANERWFGIAAIKQEARATPRQDSPPNSRPDGAKRMDWRDMQPAAQAGIRCAEPVFWAFLSDNYDAGQIRGKEEAAALIRNICGVDSRADLGTKHAARVIWHQLDEKYQAWKALEHA